MTRCISVHCELTGEVRFTVRKRWFGAPLIVLQVQERHTRTYRRGLEELDPQSHVTWRDASVEDLLAGNLSL